MNSWVRSTFSKCHNLFEVAFPVTLRSLQEKSSLVLSAGLFCRMLLDRMLKIYKTWINPHVCSLKYMTFTFHRSSIHQFFTCNAIIVYVSFKHCVKNPSPLCLLTRSKSLYFFCRALDVSNSYIVFRLNSTSWWRLCWGYSQTIRSRRLLA